MTTLCCYYRHVTPEKAGRAGCGPTKASNSLDLGLVDLFDPDCQVCYDYDVDGYYAIDPDICAPGNDCNDSNGNIYPTNANSNCDCEEPNPQGTEEICGNGIDEDCDGTDLVCPDPCAGTAGASTLGASPVYGHSDLGKHVAFFMLPLGAIIALRFWRRNSKK